MSLTELKKETGITLPVVSRLVEQLKKNKLVVEVDSFEQTQAGRPPSFIKINGNAGYILGVDLDRVYTNFVLINLEQKIILSYDVKKAFLENDPSILIELEKEIHGVLKKAKVKWDMLLGIGFSIPGIVNGRKGISETYLNFGEKPLQETLKDHLKKPVYIEHDVKAMALGEIWFGSAKGKKNVLCLKIDWGLGLGIIINGKIYYGNDSHSGELGHLSVLNNNNNNVDVCYCGKRDCLETVASGRAIIKKVKEKLSQGNNSLILEIVDDINEVDSRIIIDAANNGDQFVLEILEEMAQHIGYAAGSLINIFNPECIVLGGYIGSAAPVIFTDLVRMNSLKKSLNQLNKKVEFIRSSLGVTAGALGVATLAAKDLFEVEHLNPFAYI
jgi:glucokinase-like ROK family protein